MKDYRLNYILETLEPKPGKDLWYGGASVLGCLKGVSYEQALWKPAPGRHSIWELVLHIAYWKYSVRNKITEGKKGSFGRSPANWPVVPA